MLKNLIIASKELVKPIVTSNTLAEYKLPPLIAQDLMSDLNLSGLSIEAHTSSLKTSDTNFAAFPNQFFSFACYFYDFANELIKYFQLLEHFQKICSKKHIDAAEILFGEWDKIKSKIEGNPELKNCFENSSDIELFCKFLDQQDKTFRLGAKSPINNNNGFSIRGYDDCFGSVVLTQINLPNASSSIFGSLVYALANAPDIFLKLKEHHNNYVGLQLLKSNQTKAQEIIHIPLPKPFLLLAGISGTGKTRFVRKQAAAHYNGDLSNYCLIPVRPDWHEPSDLLGYISRIGQDGSRYVVTDLLRFVVKVWQDAIKSATAEELVCKAPPDMTPYWLCLDEMNLAPVEQYFADYLSVLETREWQDGDYSCDPLLKSATIKQLDSAGQQALRADLKLDNVLFDGLWGYFVNVGIPLPPNLIVAGTVNMDETTHGFSRKVIDRAFTIDFGVFYPNDFADYFEPITRPKTLGFPVLSQVTKVDLDTVIADKDGAISIAFLNAINTVLIGTPFELAYRALNELLLAVACFNPKNETELQAVWDDFLMSKVLPRIDGDAEKLSMVGEADNKSDVLSALLVVIETALKDILTNPRIDLLRENKDGTILTIPCRARQKLKWMKARLDLNGFTTFWP